MRYKLQLKLRSFNQKDQDKDFKMPGDKYPVIDRDPRVGGTQDIVSTYPNPDKYGNSNGGTPLPGDPGGPGKPPAIPSVTEGDIIAHIRTLLGDPKTMDQGKQALGTYLDNFYKPRFSGNDYAYNVWKSGISGTVSNLNPNSSDTDRQKGVLNLASTLGTELKRRQTPNVDPFYGMENMKKGVAPPDTGQFSRTVDQILGGKDKSYRNLALQTLQNVNYGHDVRQTQLPSGTIGDTVDTGIVNPSSDNKIFMNNGIRAENATRMQLDQLQSQYNRQKTGITTKSDTNKLMMDLQRAKQSLEIRKVTDESHQDINFQRYKGSSDESLRYTQLNDLEQTYKQDFWKNIIGGFSKMFGSFMEGNAYKNYNENLQNMYNYNSPSNSPPPPSPNTYQPTPAPYVDWGV